MDPSLLFVPATINDVPQLVTLVNSAYRGDSSRIGWTTEADLLEGTRTDAADLTEMVQKKGDTILKCIDAANRILACVYLQKKETVMYLGMLTVLPQLQAKGIGKQLLAAAENFASQQQCTTVEMTVISVRHELIDWYKKRGYHSTGITKPFPKGNKFGVAKQPLEFIVLTKIL